MLQANHSAPHNALAPARLSSPHLSAVRLLFWFLDVFSGSDRATTDSGSACVSHAVFGVPPNTSRLGFSWKAAHPKMNLCEGTAKRWVAGSAPPGPGRGGRGA